MATCPKPPPPWVAYEVVMRREDKVDLPFSRELAKSGKVPKRVLKVMKLACYHGWPSAKDVMKDREGKRLIADKGDGIWLLKCKPEPWRLYFYVRETGEERGFAYVYAVPKKKDDEDPKSAERAKRIFADIVSGKYNLQRFAFPSD